MTMNAKRSVWTVMMMLAFGVAGCGAAPGDSSAQLGSHTSGDANAANGAGAANGSNAAGAASGSNDSTATNGSTGDQTTTAAQAGELLTGTWSYVAAASCGATPFGKVDGNNLTISSGGYCSGGNGLPFHGFTYEQPVVVEAGGTYDLKLTLSNFNGWLGFIATQFTATIAGVTRTAQATASGPSVIDLSFPIDTLPPGPTTVQFNVRPPAAGVGPVNGGIYLTEEGCTVNLSLVRTN